jgi:hypothetical protein
MSNQLNPTESNIEIITKSDCVKKREKAAPTWTNYSGEVGLPYYFAELLGIYTDLRILEKEYSQTSIKAASPWPFLEFPGSEPCRCLDDESM